MKHLNYFFCTIVFCSLFSIGCEKDEPVPPAPIVDFTMSQSSAMVDEIISFTNSSENATEYVWDFGDGSNSTNINSTHSYSSAGSFIVKLTATGDGGENSTSKTIVVSYPEPVASFTLFNTEIKTGETITFTNSSVNATNYLWDFGDGSSSILETPTHSYSKEGTYTITLTATGEGGKNSTSETIVVEVGFNIIPGESAMNISLEESWATVENKLAKDYTQYGPILISGSSGYYIIHPIESKSEGIMLYFLSASGSMLLNSADIVFLISLDNNFIGQTEKGIKIGSYLSEIKSAYGTPDEHDTENNIYAYNIGIDFYYDDSSKVDGINISTPTSSLKSADILKELIKKHLRK